VKRQHGSVVDGPIAVILYPLSIRLGQTQTGFGNIAFETDWSRQRFAKLLLPHLKNSLDPHFSSLFLGGSDNDCDSIAAGQHIAYQEAANQTGSACQ